MKCALNSFNDPYNPFFFIINFAIGGNFPNTKVDNSALPSRLEVDWVRVYQTDSQIEYNEKEVKPRMKNIKGEWTQEEKNRQEEKKIEFGIISKRVHNLNKQSAAKKNYRKSSLVESSQV